MAEVEDDTIMKHITPAAEVAAERLLAGKLLDHGRTLTG